MLVSGADYGSLRVSSLKGHVVITKSNDMVTSVEAVLFVPDLLIADGSAHLGPQILDRDCASLMNLALSSTQRGPASSEEEY